LTQASNHRIREIETDDLRPLAAPTPDRRLPQQRSPEQQSKEIITAVICCWRKVLLFTMAPANLPRRARI
jgi:hypothetical protein